MVDGTEVVLMPGMMLAWILVGFCGLLLVTVLVAWLTRGLRSKEPTTRAPHNEKDQEPERASHREEQRYKRLG